MTEQRGAAFVTCRHCHFTAEGSTYPDVMAKLAAHQCLPVRADVNHGENGYSAGCKCPVCRDGHSKYNGTWNRNHQDTVNASQGRRNIRRRITRS